MVTQTATTEGAAFEMAHQPPLAVSKLFSLDLHADLWESVRARGRRPRYFGRFSDDEALRIEALRGFWMMGYELVDLDDVDELERLRASVPRRYAIQPQQLWLVDALNAGGYDEFVVESMRRTAKTTTIFCWAIGRCVSRDSYYVTFSAQNGKKGSARLREWKNRLDKTMPDPESGIPPWKRGQPTARSRRVAQMEALFGDDVLPDRTPDDASRGFRIMMGEVGKGIYFDNGSQFLVFKPDADDYRGEAGDISWVDEAQELEPDVGDELFAGIVPLQDTREDAAIVISGTAGPVRLGPFWKRVEQLRNGDPDIGGVDYCFPPETPWAEIADEDRAMKLIAAEHPGVGTLTTIEKMRKNWRKLSRPEWAREYGSLWPEDYSKSAIDGKKWRAGQIDPGAFPDLPAGKFALGIDVDPHGSASAIVAAWYDDDGVAYVGTLEHRAGTEWLVDELVKITRKYRDAVIGHDTVGAVLVEAEELARKRPQPKRRPIQFRDVGAACAAFMKQIDTGNLRHRIDDESLNAAAAGALKRPLSGENGWAWTRKTDADVTPLVAATFALRTLDQAPTQRRRRMRSSTQLQGRAA
jgi:hypothetical protein